MFANVSRFHPSLIFLGKGWEPTIKVKSRKGLSSGNLQLYLETTRVKSDWQWQTLYLILTKQLINAIEGFNLTQTNPQILDKARQAE